MKNNTLLNTLPAEIQNKIIDRLKAYDDVTVSFEYGEYRFGTVIKAQYAPDHKVIGRFFAKDIFTDEERMLNYCESFHDFPPQYKGKRNYRMFNGTTWETKFKFDENNNIVIA